MEAIAHSPSFAKKVGVPQSVGQDFAAADKALKLPTNTRTRADLQTVNKPKTNQGRNELFKEGGNTMATKMNPGFMAMMAKKKGMQEGSKADMASDKKQMMGMKKGGMAGGGTFRASANGIASKGKTKGTQIKMNKGGKAC